ncbi:MAG: hypothetical protein ACYDBB_18280 [Armatimonadota bacterium]
MRNTSYRLLIGLALWTVLSSSGTPARAESVPAATMRATVENWQGKLTWQPAPTGPGEFSLLPMYGPGSYLYTGKRTLAGSDLGLLTTTDGTTWEMVPHLFGSYILPVTEQHGMLWVQKIGEVRSYPQKWGALLALDPQTLAVKREVPSIVGRCLAVEANGFWCQYDYHAPPPPDATTTTPNPAQQAAFNPSTPIISALIEFDRDGKELRRFVADGKALPQGQVQRVFVDAEAVWVLSIKRDSYSVHSGLRSGPRGGDYSSPQYQFSRVDRKTGAITTVSTSLWMNNPTVNLPDRLLWVKGTQSYAYSEYYPQALRYGQASSDTPPAPTPFEVYQLDKTTMKITKAGTVKLSGVQTLASDGKHLWIFARGASVFALKDFQPVPADAAGAPPAGSPPPFTYAEKPSTTVQYTLQRADGKWGWLLGSDSALYALGDDGAGFRHDLSGLVKVLDGYLRVVTRGPFAYTVADGFVLRVEAGKPEVRLAQLPESPNNYANLLCVGEKYLWLRYGEEQLYAVSADLHQWSPAGNSREMRSGEYMAEVGGKLYLTNYRGYLLRADPATGKLTTVEAWTKFFPASNRGDDMPSLEAGYLQALIALPDGRLAAHLGPRSAQDKGKSLVYDPAKETLQELAEDDFTALVSTAQRQFRTADGQLQMWQGAAWKPLGKIPAFTTYTSPTPVPLNGTLQTERYLYTNTAFGLFRVPVGQ